MPYWVRHSQTIDVVNGLPLLGQCLQVVACSHPYLLQIFRQVLPADNILAAVIYILDTIFLNKYLLIFQLQYTPLNKICYNISNNKSKGEIIVREFIHYIYLVLKLIVIVIFLYIFAALAFVIVGGILMDLFLK